MKEKYNETNSISMNEILERAVESDTKSTLLSDNNVIRTTNTQKT